MNTPEEDEIEIVAKYLERAEEAGVEIEVVAWMIKGIRQGLSVAQAFEEACWEWDC